MVNAETLIIDPPDHVVSIFDYVMLKLTETDTLEEKKALREELINEEEHKVLGLIFQEGEVNVYLAITGIKRAINTYMIEEYSFVYIGPDGIFRRSLDREQSGLARQALQLILLDHNFDVNVKPYQF